MACDFVRVWVLLESPRDTRNRDTFSDAQVSEYNWRGALTWLMAHFARLVRPWSAFALVRGVRHCFVRFMVLVPGTTSR